MKFKNIKFVFIGFAIFIVIFAAIKVTSKNEKKQNNENQEVRETAYQDNISIGISNLDTTNPLTTKNKQLIDIYQLVYEPLLTLNSEYKLTGCLAKEYAKTSATTYIVKIDNSIKFADGSELKADDVKFTVALLKNSNNIYSENVKNIASVEAIDSSTVKFNLTEETYFFEYNLIFPIMCKNYYGGEDFYKSAKNAIGTGRYKIESISDNQIVLDKNSDYRNPNMINSNVQKIYVNIFNEVGEVYNSFKIGNIDFMATSNPIYENYIGTIGYYVKEYKGREYDFLSCNCNDYTMKDKSVRQAINLAIDKENIISTVYNNKYYASEYALDYGNFIYAQNSSSSGYNPGKAKEVLMSAGWTYGNNRWRKDGRNLVITISVNSSNAQRCEVAKIIKEQLEDIGIQVYVSEVSDSQYNAYLANKNYQVILTGVYNGYSPDLTYFYGNGNIANYGNEEVKSIINEVKNITDVRLLEEKYKRIIDITKDECPYISLYRNKNFLLINQNVVGSFEPTNYGMYNNFESWKKE